MPTRRARCKTSESFGGLFELVSRTMESGTGGFRMKVMALRRYPWVGIGCVLGVAGISGRMQQSPMFVQTSH